MAVTSKTNRKPKRQDKHTAFPRTGKKRKRNKKEGHWKVYKYPRDKLGLFAEAAKKSKPHIGNWMDQ